MEKELIEKIIHEILYMPSIEHENHNYISASELLMFIQKELDKIKSDNQSKEIVDMSEDFIKEIEKEDIDFAVFLHLLTLFENLSLTERKKVADYFDY